MSASVTAKARFTSPGSSSPARAIFATLIKLLSWPAMAKQEAIHPGRACNRWSMIRKLQTIGTPKLRGYVRRLPSCPSNHPVTDDIRCSLLRTDARRKPATASLVSGVT
eukprot:6046145-Pyramimonas_sp.AAC.1